MKREKGEKKTYAKPRMDEVQDENNIALDGKYSLVKKEEK